jgi:hypothetical protein
MTKNDELANGTGQESTTHEPIEKYDSAHGRYSAPDTQLAIPAPRPTATDPSPFGTMRKGG